LRRAILVSLLACAALPAVAQAKQSASLHVTFNPEHLGHSSSVYFAIQINAPAGQVPPPLTELDMHYPSSLGLAVSGLGIASCSPATIDAIGPRGCPADSRMGQGEALAEIAFGPDVLRETAEVTIFRAPENDGQIALIFFADGTNPVSTEIAFPALLLPGPTPNDETIHLGLPLVPALPEGPDVAVVQLHATFGPHGLTYYEHERGKHIAYHPNGILLPRKCPHGGFTFSANLTFQDRSHTDAQTAVPCPARQSHRDTGSPRGVL
jgi:hypothetical protein